MAAWLCLLVALCTAFHVQFIPIHSASEIIPGQLKSHTWKELLAMSVLQDAIATEACARSSCCYVTRHLTELIKLAISTCFSNQTSMKSWWYLLIDFELYKRPLHGFSLNQLQLEAMNSCKAVIRKDAMQFHFKYIYMEMNIKHIYYPIFSSLLSCHQAVPFQRIYFHFWK